MSQKVTHAPVERLLFSRREAAQMLGLCPSTVDNLLRAGKLPFVVMGSRRLIPADALREFAAGGHSGRIRK